jgi:hypothetical protein
MLLDSNYSQQQQQHKQLNIIFFEFKMSLTQSLTPDAMRTIANRVGDTEKKSRLASDFILQIVEIYISSTRKAPPGLAL